MVSKRFNSITLRTGTEELGDSMRANRLDAGLRNPPPKR